MDTKLAVMQVQSKHMLTPEFIISGKLLTYCSSKSNKLIVLLLCYT
jgi:hypothetical protein